jgi:hypothetical protein
MSLNDGFTLGGKFQCICFRQMLDFMWDFPFTCIWIG